MSPSVRCLECCLVLTLWAQLSPVPSLVGGWVAGPVSGPGLRRYESGELDKPVTPDLTHASLDSTLSTRINIACLESNTLDRNERFNLPLERGKEWRDGSKPESELCSGYLRESVIYFVFVVNGGRMHEVPRARVFNGKILAHSSVLRFYLHIFQELLHQWHSHSPPIRTELLHTIFVTFVVIFIN